MSADHTATPWFLRGKGTIRNGDGPKDPRSGWIADVHWRNRDANAEFIVRAVNSFDDLVAALKTVAAQHALFVGPDDDIANATKEVVRAALAKAEAHS